MPIETRKRLLTFAAVVLAVAAAAGAAAQPPAPESFFGFRMGADARLADWPSILRYFETVASTSDRVRLVEVGTTTEGRRMIAALVSAPVNLARLDSIRRNNRRLADPRQLSAAELPQLIVDQPVVVAIGCSIHGTEVGATQTANELLHELATAEDGRTLSILQNVLVVLFPSLNPDGHTVATEWYERYKGTSFEGGPIPWLYHKYAGHDINRDAFMLNLTETRLLARFFYGEWHPQVFLSMHQMGSNGARLFVPPNYEPIDPNYDPIIWREAALLGSAMALELESKGRSGVVSNALYDYYWPGYEDSAPLGHNTVCLLTEAAGVRLATPIEVAAARLTGSPRGLPKYAPQTTFPNPWPGGAWRLRDIVDYEMDASRGLLDAAARYRRELIGGFYQMGSRAVATGAQGAPFAFVIPAEQHDPSAAARLAGLLIDNGVEVREAREMFRAADTVYPPGTRIVLMAQPFRAFAKTLLERQVYPVRSLAPGAPPERPYDVAGWTLPLQMGVRVDRIEQRFEPPVAMRLESPVRAMPGRVWGEQRPSWFIVEASGSGGTLAANRLARVGARLAWITEPVEANGFRYPPGSIVAQGGKGTREAVQSIARELGLRADGMKGRPPSALMPLGSPRVGLYKSWMASIDEGWTRLLLEQYGFSFQNLADGDIRKGGLRASFDVIILPDQTPEQIIGGHKPGAVPPMYAGGLGTEGVAALRTFIEAGGTLICLDSSSAFAIDALALPVRNAIGGLKPEQFFCPGSILRLTVDPANPIGYGMQADAAAFFAFGMAFDVLPALSGDAASAAVVARYGARDVLLSGWLEGESEVAGRAAVVDVRLGAGRVVLIGFRAQHRAQSMGTFRLLFNAIQATPGATARRSK